MRTEDTPGDKGVSFGWFCKSKMPECGIEADGVRICDVLVWRSVGRDCQGPILCGSRLSTEHPHRQGFAFGLLAGCARAISITGRAAHCFRSLLVADPCLKHSGNVFHKRHGDAAMNISVLTAWCQNTSKYK